MTTSLLVAQLLNGLQYGVMLFLLAAGLTLESAKLCSLPVKQWRQRAIPVDNRTPTVFLVGR